MTANTTTEVTHFEVVWGDDEADRIVYTDEHDGSSLSNTAEGRATQTFLRMSANSTPCGFWTNGRLTAGQNVTEGPDQRPAYLDDPNLYALWVAGKLNDDGSAKEVDTEATAHRTRTVLNGNRGERYVTKSNGSCGRWVADDDSVALCTCGWKWHAGSRAEARSAARGHRAETALAA